MKLSFNFNKIYSIMVEYFDLIYNCLYAFLIAIIIGMIFWVFTPKTASAFMLINNNNKECNVKLFRYKTSSIKSLISIKEKNEISSHSFIISNYKTFCSDIIQVENYNNKRYNTNGIVISSEIYYDKNYGYKYDICKNEKNEVHIILYSFDDDNNNLIISDVKFKNNKEIKKFIKFVYENMKY